MRLQAAAGARMSAIQRSRSRSARAVSACLRAIDFSVPRRRLPSALFGRRVRERRKQAEIDVHRLERARPVVDGLDVPAGDVAEQGSERRGRRRACRLRPADVGCSEQAGQQADARRFHVALAAGHLAGKAQTRRGVEAQLAVQQRRRIEKRVAMQAAEPGELGVRQALEWCGRSAPARRASAWSGSRPCCRACRACCPGAAGRWRRPSPSDCAGWSGRTASSGRDAAFRGRVRP